MAKGNISLIDVRNPEEIILTGRLQYGPVTAVNIPLHEIVADALTLSPNRFGVYFGLPKPEKDSIIVFSCRSGVRSLFFFGLERYLLIFIITISVCYYYFLMLQKRSVTASLEAEKHGFINVYNYTGGANDWFANE